MGRSIDGGRGRNWEEPSLCLSVRPSVRLCVRLALCVGVCQIQSEGKVGREREWGGGVGDGEREGEGGAGR